MAQLTVRDVAAALRAQAARNGRSAEAEHRIILRDTLAPRTEAMVDFVAAAARLRARLAAGPGGGVDARSDGTPDGKEGGDDSAEFIRIMRDERYG